LHNHIESGTLQLTYVPTEENLADIFTKALPWPLHERLTGMLGILATNYNEEMGVKDKSENT
jgi:hypothetical protein